MAEHNPPKLFITRKDAIEAGLGSIDTLRKLEAIGRLTPFRLTGGSGMIYYAYDQFLALTKGAGGEVDA
jgi:hypothetical protein